MHVASGERTSHRQSVAHGELDSEALLPARVRCVLQVVPFLLEDKLQELGAQLSKAKEDWGEHVVTDGNLITGQNPGKGHVTCAQHGMPK